MADWRAYSSAAAVKGEYSETATNIGQLKLTFQQDAEHVQVARLDEEKGTRSKGARVPLACVLW